MRGGPAFYNGVHSQVFMLRWARRVMMAPDIVELSRPRLRDRDVYHFLTARTDPLPVWRSCLMALPTWSTSFSGKQICKDTDQVSRGHCLVSLHLPLWVWLQSDYGSSSGPLVFYYSLIAGDIFGAPLAIEGLVFGLRIPFVPSVLLRLGSIQVSSAYMLVSHLQPLVALGSKHCPH